jgi:hypothetical protein
VGGKEVAGGDGREERSGKWGEDIPDFVRINKIAKAKVS